MERFYLEKPSLSRKNQILEYIEEIKKMNRKYMVMVD